MNFTSSITLAFKDAFSTGFNQAQNSLAGMKSALGEINQNQEMIRLASDLSIMNSTVEPMRQALSTALDEPSRIAGNLDSSLKNIQAVSGNTAKEMAGIRRELLAVGGDAIAGPKGVAAAYYDVASGVGNVSARMATLEKSVALAEAGQAKLVTSTKGMISVMNAYNYSADKAGFAADVFTRTVGKGVGSMDEFVSAMSPIAGLTANVGIGFNKLGQMMAFITAKGQTASAASTQIKSAITSLLNPNAKMISLLESMGIQSGSTMLKQYGLAESLLMIKDALGGSQDAMAQVLGSQESLQAALYLTQKDFAGFAADFSENMEGITKKARAVQLQSIEAKMARLDAASDALKARIGGDINQIKGFFIDMKIGFLNNVVAPIMRSDVGPVFSKIVAFAGMGAKAVLDLGGTVLTTATQMSILTTNIANAGGIVKLFKSTLGLLGAPFKGLVGLCKGFIFRLLGIGGASAAAATGTGVMGTASAASAGGIGVATGATTAFGASLWATLWPILAVIGAIALIAGGVYLLVKNWDSVSSFFGNLWKGITKIFTAAWDWIVDIFNKGKNIILVNLFPFIGIPMLIIKNWDSIKSFFGNLWKGITNVFSNAWNGIKSLFNNLWNGITGIFNKGKKIVLTILFPFIGIPMLIIKNWDSIKSFFGNLWNGITTIFSNAWNGIKGFLSNLWNGIVGIFNKGKKIILTILFPFIGIPMLIIKNWDSIKSFFGNLWNGITNVFSNTWNGIINSFSNAWNGIKSFFTNLWNGIVGIFNKGKSFILAILFPFIEIPKLIIKNWDSVKSFFGNLWKGITTIFSNAWNGITNVFSNAWKGISNISSTAWNGIKNFFTNLWNGVAGIFNKGKNFILAILSPFIGAPSSIINNWNGIKSFFGELWTGIVRGFTGAWNGITGFFTNLWEGIKTSFTGFIDWVKGPINTIGDIIGGIGDFFGGIFGNAKDSGQGLNDAFAAGINQNSTLPGQTFNKSLQGIDSQLPHSDAKEGPLSRLTESGRDLIKTFASGMNIYDLKDTVEKLFSNLFPEKLEPAFVLQGLSIPADKNNKSMTIHIDKLYVQSDEIKSVMDFIKILIDAVKRPDDIGDF